MLFINPEENIIAFNFESINQDIKKPLTCKNIDVIAGLEENFIKNIFNIKINIHI